MVGVYVIVSPTNKVYVGQSLNIKNRLNHYTSVNCKGQTKLYASLKKHGWEAHTFEVIMPLRDDISPEMLTYWEQFFMDYYRAEGYELMNLKGASSKGKYSEESKQKMSLSRQKHIPYLKERFKGENNPMWGIKGEKHPSYGRKFSEETLRKLSESHKNQVVTEETRRKIGEISKKRFENPLNNPMYGKHHTEETKQKLREKLIGSKSPSFKFYVLAYKNGEFIGKYEGISDTARKLNLSAGNICMVLSGRYNSTKGYTFTKEYPF